MTFEDVLQQRKFVKGEGIWHRDPLFSCRPSIDKTPPSIIIKESETLETYSMTLMGLTRKFGLIEITASHLSRATAKTDILVIEGRLVDAWQQIR